MLSEVSTPQPGPEEDPAGSHWGTSPGDASRVRTFVPEYRQTTTLTLLQQVIDTADAANVALARRASLSLSELHALRLLADAPLGPVELARALSITSAASSGVVDRLCARGHAERHAHAADKRRTVVDITDSGRRELLIHLTPMFSRLAAVDSSLSDEERAVVERYLTGAIEAMRAIN